MSAEHQFESDPSHPKNQTRYNYLVSLLLKKIGTNTNTYLDYDFVCNFTIPNCWEIHTADPSFQIVSTKDTFIRRVFNYLSSTPREYDDCISVLLDSLVASGFLESYQYIWWPFTETVHHWCCHKTYYDFFDTINKSLLFHAQSHWGSAQLKTLSFDTDQFIDSHGFILWVGKWETRISVDACEFTRNVGPKVQFYRDYRTKKLYMRNRETGAEVYIGRRKKWYPDIFLILDELLNDRKNWITNYEITELLERREIKYVKNPDGLLDFRNNQLSTLDELLLLIGVNPDEVYTYKDGVFCLIGDQEIQFYTGF